MQVILAGRALDQAHRGRSRSVRLLHFAAAPTGWI